MRFVVLFLIGIHGVIHLLGFLRAFEIADVQGISPSSKSQGLLWLVTSVLFILALAFHTFQFKHWWVFAALALVISQVLIVINWSDAKYGTLLNLIILIPTMVAFFTSSFQSMVANERTAMLQEAHFSKDITDEKDLSALPLPVKNWLARSGVIGKEAIHTVYLQQDLEMKTQPDQVDWVIGQADQYFSVNPPAFNWSLDLKLNPILSMKARDKYANGKGEMLIKIGATIPVVDTGNTEKVNQATLQRYLAEIVWFPSAALSPYISWEQLDNHSAKATMTFGGVEGSGIFYFDENGDFEKFLTMRFKEATDDQPTPWKVHTIKTGELNGIRMPLESEASWELENKDWTWLRVKIKSAEYNVKSGTADPEQVGS